VTVVNRETYQAELDALRADVVAMGEMVADRLATAVAALADRDAVGASAVAEADDAVNERYLDVERRCIELYALQQPVAGDLRLVTASFKISTDLERIGDLASNLAACATELDPEEFPDVELGPIGWGAVEMIERALVAYAEADSEACASIAEYDEKIDRLCTEASDAVARALLERDPTAPETDTEALMGDVSRLLLTIRDLERAADHAVNVAARTLYMVRNDDRLI